MSRYFLSIILLIFFSFPSHSAIILKIKGRKALVDLEGVKAEKGDKFDALNLYGKALGVLEIKKVKRGKAIAVLLKGKMGVNWFLEHAAQGTGADLDAEGEYDPAGEQVKDSNKNTYTRGSGSSGFFSKSTVTSSGMGAILGLHFNTFPISENKSISGRSWKGALFVDYNIISPLGIRLIAGYHSLLVSGPKCGLSTCNLLIHYPGVGLLLRGVFLEHLILQPWIGAGGFLLWPIADRRDNLGLGSKSFESFHGILTVAGGIDIHFKGFYIPLQFDINWTNPLMVSITPVKEGSTQFRPYYIGAKIGIAFSF